MCEACLEDVRLHALTVERVAERHGEELRRSAITTADLERHARRFGPEGIEELAAELGVKVTLERPKAKPRKGGRGPTLKARVAEHVAEGRSAELIAELENLSPSRARRLIQEVSS